MTDITTIKRQLNAQIESLCGQLLPNGKRVGAEWCVGSVEGEKGKSTRVHLTGEKTGVWSDFSTGESGDVLDLICAVKGLTLAESLEWSKTHLGVSEPQFYQSAPPKEYRKPARRAEVKVPQNGVVHYLMEQRGLLPDMLKQFKIGEMDTRDFRLKGDAVHKGAAIVFPSLVGDELRFVKYLAVDRPEGNKLTDVEPGCEPVLFGWQTSSGNEREVVLCEGEINAMSWRQLGFFALATPFGAGKGGKHNWVDREWERLERFETIYLDFDQDPPGREAVAELTQRLGIHRCLVVPAKPDGYKDINDYLQAGCGDMEAMALLDNAKGCDPKELRAAVEFTEDVIDQFYSEDPDIVGLDPGFKGLKGQFAWRLGEVTLFTGYSGHGKTLEVDLEILKLCIQGQRACIASFEVRGPKTMKRMVRQATGQKLPSQKYIRQVMEWTRNRLWIFDHVGSARIDRILEVFEYAFRRYNVRWFVIDSLTKCGIREDDYDKQKEFVDMLANFVNVHNVGIILVAHTRKQDDETDPPGKFDVRGHASITDLIHNGVTVWRNKPKELARELYAQNGVLPESQMAKLNEPDALMIFWKIREAEEKEPRLGLYFDDESLQYADDARDLGKPLVPFTNDAPTGKEFYDEVD